MKLGIILPKLNLLETVDLMLLRRMLRAPKSTPKEMLFLELGCLPYEKVLQKRRLMFLQYILKEDPKSMIHKFFESQVKNPTTKDWVTSVRNDLKDIKMSATFADIKAMPKSKFKNMLKNDIERKAVLVLEEKKASHSKVMNIKHGFLRMQTYLMPSQIQIRHQTDERHLVFQLRSAVTDVKMNF